ncbi:MAG: cytochrome b N-terminal domain-containing protein, partial [Planctomycetota bacterium]
MTGAVRALGDWLSSRGLGIERLRVFLDKRLPRNVAWLHTLGSLLLCYLLFQGVTGVLLSLYYTPAPGGAYASVRFIHDEVAFGAFLLKLHRYGAGFLMVTAFLHFARSYFLAAYKPPRELLWLTGLLLGTLLTLFAFTGQLLPYDQRGYWATVVGINIASSAPVVGGGVRDLLTGGYGEIGAASLSTFFILHVCVLPLAFAALAGAHLGVLQRVGPAPPTTGSPEPTRSFYPAQMTRDVLVAAGGAVLLFVAAALIPQADTGPADAAGAGFTPRPEWYFLAHYEVMRVVPGV